MGEVAEQSEAGEGTLSVTYVPAPPKGKPRSPLSRLRRQLSQRESQEDPLVTFGASSQRESQGAFLDFWLIFAYNKIV